MKDGVSAVDSLIPIVPTAMTLIRLNLGNIYIMIKTVWQLLISGMLIVATK